MSELIKADAKARCRVMVVSGVALICGVVLITGYQAKKAILAEWITRHLEDFTAHPEVVLLALLLPFLPLILFAIFLVRYSVKVMKAQRIPLPGESVIKDTYVIEGDKAIARAKLILGLATILGLVGLVLPVMFAYILLTVAAI